VPQEDEEKGERPSGLTWEKKKTPLRKEKGGAVRPWRKRMPKRTGGERMDGPLGRVSSGVASVQPREGNRFFKKKICKKTKKPKSHKEKKTKTRGRARGGVFIEKSKVL